MSNPPENLKGLNGILLYPEQNFSGTPYHIDGPVSISKLSDVKLTPAKVASVLIGEGYRMFLYQDKYFLNEYKHFAGPVAIPRLMSFDNKVESIIVARSGLKIDNGNEVALIHNGQGLILTAPLKVNNITRLGIPTNGLDSVSIGRNISLRVYDSENYSGEHLDLSGPYVGSLGDMNNKVSSLEISFKKTPDPPTHDGDGWIWLLILFVILVIIIAYLLMRKH